MRLRAIAIAAAIVGLFGGTSSALAASGGQDSPGHYYLALGDSLAYGFQQSKFDAGVAGHDVEATAFNTGYVDDFATMLRTVQDPIGTVNFGCPGETTDSYFVGCAWHAKDGLPLHDTYAGSQDAAALAFLRAHRRQVNVITVDLGANDALHLAYDRCHLVPSCIAPLLPGVLTTVGVNLHRLLAELRAASPTSEVIVMTYYNPLFVLSPQTDLLIGQLNAVIQGAAAAHGARLADAFAPINGASSPALELASVCTYTLMCPAGDIHASDAGYAVIAQQFWAASGYSESNQDN